MFSGIVETMGLITRAEIKSDCLRVSISPHVSFSDIKIGDSISVNGTCLTVHELNETSFDVTIVPETRRLTNLEQLNVGSLVNLERSIKVGDRISGHYVQGHVDAIGEIIEIKADGADAIIVKIGLPPALMKYIVRKGYVAIDGMSITVIDVGDRWFTVTLIPHTREVCIAQKYYVGSKVNIEVDMLGKYVENFIRENDHASTN